MYGSLSISKQPHANYSTKKAGWQRLYLRKDVHPEKRSAEEREIESKKA
jgi:hypothetical protein